MVVSARDGEFNVAQAERLGARVRGVPVGVLGRAKQPEETEDGEVADVGVEPTPLGVCEVEGSVDGFDDGEVGGVRARGWVVVALEAVEESSE